MLQTCGREELATASTVFSCPHDHDFLSERHHANERRTWWVIFLTVTTMGLEIVSGLLFGSMALLADGWHMASHASALGITALAYYLARHILDAGRLPAIGRHSPGAGEVRCGG